MREVQSLGLKGTGYIDKRFGKEQTAYFCIFECPRCLKHYELVKGIGAKRVSCRDCRGFHQVTHGMSGTRPYHTWRSMLDRCLNPNNSKFKIYGGKGITVCEEWKTFEGFWAANKEFYDAGLTIDRKDSSKGYYPENVRWITHNQNSSETTKRRAVIQFSKTPLPGGILERLNRFESALQAAQALNLVPAHITVVCQGNAKRKTHGGFIWQYEEDVPS